MMTTLKNCKLADGQTTDIILESGTIKSIGHVEKTDQEINLSGKLVIPGVIDAHVHFREPGGEHKEDWSTGSQAAVSGGVTTVIDMPNNKPPAIDNIILNEKRDLAKKSLVNYGFYIGATKDNLQEIQGAYNIAGGKIYVGSSTGDLLVDKDEDIARLFTIPHILWVIHAEDEYLIAINEKSLSNKSNPAVHSKIRDKKVAIIALKRVIQLAEKNKTNIHICHISTKEEVELIKQAKNKGLAITGEVSPHHLFLNESAYQKHGFLVKVNPPLRTTGDNTALWQALKKGVIDIVATDHAPHTLAEKQPGTQEQTNNIYNIVPAGIPEVETSLPLLLNEVNKNNLTLQRLIEVTSQKPAEIFHLKNKGAIKEGYDADLTVVDLEKQQTITKEMLKTKCGWSPYQGWQLIGWPIMTFVNGNLVFDNGNINNEFKGKEIQYGKI